MWLYEGLVVVSRMIRGVKEMGLLGVRGVTRCLERVLNKVLTRC